jgi:hypothetical protein
MREGQAALLCSLGDAPEPPQLCAAIQRYIERELQMEEATEIPSPAVQMDELMSLDAAPHGGVLLDTLSTTLASDVQGRSLHPLLLSSRREGQRTIAGVVALRFRAGRRTMPPASLLDALADALIAYDDVDPVTCIV